MLVFKSIKIIATGIFLTNLSLVFIKLNYFLTELTKLLVANGGYSDFSKSVEVVNLDPSKPDLMCDNLPDYPVGVAGSTGQLFQGTTPIICGGARPDRWESLCSCYALKDGGWNEMPSLNNCHRFASSALLSLENNEEVFLVTGGYIDFVPLDFVEGFNGIDWDQERFSDLLQPVFEHCLVKINSTTLLSIGGAEGSVYDSVPNTYFYNVQDNQWITGPSLNTPRAGSSCEVLNWKNPETNKVEKVVVAAGGYDTETVELLFLEGSKNNGWVMGPSLPETAYLSTMIGFQNSVVLIGGGEGLDGHHLYQLSSPSEPWIEMEQTLKKSMSGHVAFLIPDDLVTCH